MLSGCTVQTVKFYDGPSLSGRKLATLTFSFTVNVKIDGKNIIPEPSGLVIQRHVKLLPGNYDIQWYKAGSDYNFVYRGSGILKAEPGQRYQIKCDYKKGATRLTGTSISSKYFWHAILDYTTWIENTDSGKVLVGRKLGQYPDDFENFNTLGQTSYENKDYENSIKYLRQALEIDPDSILSLNKLAYVLISAPESELRNPLEAVELCKKACHLSKYKNFRYLDLLAAAYARNKQFNEAIETAEKAVILAEVENNKSAAREIVERIELYKHWESYNIGENFQFSENPKNKNKTSSPYVPLKL